MTLARPPRREVSFGFRLLYALAGLIPGQRRILRTGLAPSSMTIMGAEFDLTPAANATEFKMYRDGRPSEWQSIAELIRLTAGKRCLFLDIGANVGLYSVLLGRQMAPESRIIAFEPNPAVAARLAQNLAINDLSDLVQIEQVALGATDTTGVLNVSHRNLGASSLVIRPTGISDPLEVPVRRLSDYLQDIDTCEVSLLKIDVEGYEDEVLSSLLDQQVPSLPDVVLLEIEHKNNWKRDLLSELFDLGYKKAAQTNGNVLLKLTDHPT